MATSADSGSLEDLLAAVICRPEPAEADIAELCRRLREDPVTAAFESVGFPLAGRARERLDVFARSGALCPSVKLDVAGHPVEAHISRRELWRFYLPVCQAARLLAERRRGRVLVGVAGSGASGKSVFARLLQEAFNRGLADAVGPAALCPLDGFHYPNAYLDAHFTARLDGTRVPMREMKGALETFDAEAFARCLERLVSEPSVSLPRYDRRIHDSVPDGIRIGPAERVVFVEGNFLLLDTGSWARAAGLLDLSLFLAQPLAAVQQAMIARHMLGGRSRPDAVAHFENVDRPNFFRCMESAGRADLVVRRDAHQRVVGIEAAPFDSPPVAVI